MPISKITPASISGLGYGFKNRLINGNMAIAQRGTSGTMTSNTYPSLDRWSVYGGSHGTFSRVSAGLSGFLYAAKVQRNASSTVTGNLQLCQVIESQNMLDLAGQVVTYSFWAKAGANLSSTSSQMYYGLSTGTVADQGGSGSIASWTGATSPINTTYITVTTTWQKFSFQATIPSDALEMVVYAGFFPTGTAGADDSILMTGVQLEAGSVATSFDYRPYGDELALCQRYYTQFSYVSGSNIIPSACFNNATTNGLATIMLPVTMRTAPTGIVISSASHFTYSTGTSNLTPSAVTFTAAGPSNVSVNCAVTGATVGSGGLFYFTSTAGAYIGVSGTEL